jgi:hypothetical protein
MSTGPVASTRPVRCGDKCELHNVQVVALTSARLLAPPRRPHPFGPVKLHRLTRKSQPSATQRGGPAACAAAVHSVGATLIFVTPHFSAKGRALKVHVAAVFGAGEPITSFARFIRGGGRMFHDCINKFIRPKVAPLGRGRLSPDRWRSLGGHAPHVRSTQCGKRRRNGEAIQGGGRGRTSSSAVGELAMRVIELTRTCSQR